MLEPGQYTARDLQQEAVARGLPEPSGRLIHDWPSKGLLASPLRASSGYKSGVKGLWSAEQAEVFLSIYALRTRQDARLLDLANLPVYTWLTGDDAWVPLEQARRALRFWAERVRVMHDREFAPSVGKFLAPYAPDAEVAEEWTQQTMRLAYGTASPERVHALSERVFAPPAANTPSGVLLAAAYPESALDSVEGFANLEALDDDTLCEAVREKFQLHLRNYERNQRRMGPPLPPLTPESVMTAACIDFITYLGRLIRWQREGRSGKEAPTTGTA